MTEQANRITYEGYWYEFERRLARHDIDICLGTTDPHKFCNGLYLYSMKDPGDGIAFVVTDTNDPVTKAELLIQPPVNEKP